jgi:hypothetical protein
MFDVILVVPNSKRAVLGGAFPPSVLVTSIGDGLAGTRAKAVVVAIGKDEYCCGAECLAERWDAEIETLNLKLNNGGKMIFLKGDA